jgi:hypothetical protein
MCLGCWEEYGSPTLDTPEIRRLVKVIERIYSFSGAGGGLHIVLDDWNIEDGDILWCMQYRPGYRPDGLPLSERVCAKILLAMTIEERASALYMQWYPANGGV